MLFSELYKITASEVTFVGFRGGERPNRPYVDPPLPLQLHLQLMGFSNPQLT